MPTEILQKVDDCICFCVSADLSPADPATDMRVGTPTNVTHTHNNLANGAGRQSNKADLGSVRAAAFGVYGVVDFTGETPTATGRVDYYWMPSAHATAANGNIAGNSGLDGAAPDGALGSITLAELIKQCVYIGTLWTHDGAVVQNGFVGILRPDTRYGQLLIVNNSGDTFEQDNVEAHTVFIPVVDEAQTP